MKEFADDNFRFDENGTKLSKQVENTMGKGEIACYDKQFLLYPQCFQKACFPGASIGVIVWECVKAGGLLIQVVSNTGLTVLETIFFQSQWFLFHFTNFKTMFRREREMNPVALTIINPRKEIGQTQY